MTKLSKKIQKAGIEFNQNSTLPLKNQRRLVVMERMMATAKTCIKGMTYRISKEKLCILTAVAAIFLPCKADKMHGTACGILGINKAASYTKHGMENRIAYDNFLKIKGDDIITGDKVLCRDGCGTLLAKDDNISITISLEPWEYHKTYNPIGKARMARWEPDLDAYDRVERSDVTLSEWIEAIDTFLRKHNHQSPNTKDVISRRHPDHPAVKEEKVRVYRYESWNELWDTFQVEHPGIADKIRNQDNPKECPSIIRQHAPWELVKGKDSSCLCMNCEGTNAVVRGTKGAIKTVGSLMNHINTTYCTIIDDSEVEEEEDTSESDTDEEEEDTKTCSYPNCSVTDPSITLQNCIRDNCAAAKDKDTEESAKTI